MIYGLVFKALGGRVKRVLDAAAEQRRVMGERYREALSLLASGGYAPEVARHVAGLYARGEITRNMIVPLAKRLQRVWEEERMKRIEEGYRRRFAGGREPRGWGWYPW